MASQRIALVTGGNKGIGFEIVRQLARQGILVLLGARDEGRGKEAARQLRDEQLDVQFVLLDQTKPETIAAAAAQIEQRYGQLDILVNNAGILLDQGTPTSQLNDEALERTLETNVRGVIRVTLALLPLLQRSPAGRIVNISSSGGSLTQQSEGAWNFAPAYQMSKTTLNAFTVMLAQELKTTPIKVNSACPGWVKTDMGGPNAPGTTVEGADTPVWLATLPADGPTGGFFSSRRPVPW